MGRAETISQEISNLTEDAGQDLETEENVEIGSIQGTVVGLRYYPGVVRILAFNEFLRLFHSYISYLALMYISCIQNGLINM